MPAAPCPGEHTPTPREPWPAPHTGAAGRSNRSRDATVEPGDTAWPHGKRWFPKEPAPRSAVPGKLIIQTYQRRSDPGGKAGFTALIGPYHRAGRVRQPTPGRRPAPQIRRRIRSAPRIRERSGTNHLLAGSPEGSPGTRLRPPLPRREGAEPSSKGKEARKPTGPPEPAAKSRRGNPPPPPGRAPLEEARCPPGAASRGCPGRSEAPGHDDRAHRQPGILT